MFAAKNEPKIVKIGSKWPKIAIYIWSMVIFEKKKSPPIWLKIALNIGLREDINTKKLFNSGIARITQTPPPHPPIRATLPTLSGRQKRRFARMAEKNTDDDNNCCHDNFDQNFGNFDDNDDKTY